MNIKKIIIVISISILSISNINAQSTNIVGETVVGIIGESAFISTDPGGFESVTISDSSLTGGDAQSIATASPLEQILAVGDGYSDQGLATTIDISNSIFQGGNGSTGTNLQGSAKSFGGNGVNIERGDLSFSGDFSPSTITINSGTFTGGSGGSVSIFSEATPSIYEQTYLNIPGAHGGHGFRFTRLDQSTPSLYFGATQDDTIVINDGTFVGGAGGVVTNLSDGLINAQGGSGAFIDYADITINGGTFTGGTAGLTNGISDLVGAGVHVQDSNLTINDGNFIGVGLRVENRYYDSVNTISNGTFEIIEYISNYDDYTPTVDPTFDGSNRTTRANIYGGSISNIVLSGSTYNEININGGTIDQLTFTSDAFGEDTVYIDSSANVGLIKVESNAINRVVFENDILPLNTSLDLGMNAIISTNLTTQADNQIQSTYGLGISNNEGDLTFGTGVLFVDNLTLAEGTKWTFVNSEVSPFSDFSSLNGTNDFLLAMANTGSLTNNLSVDDITLVGNTQWLYDINGFNIVTDGLFDRLYATYGIGQLNEILGVTGDLLVVANVLQPQLDTSEELRSFIQNQYDNADDLRVGLTDTYLRTPEVAQTSIGIQSIVLGQISDRIKTYREHQFLGNGISPRGPNGWFEDIKYWNKNGGIRDSLKNAERKIKPSRQFESNMWEINERFENNEKDEEIIPVRKPFTSGYVGKGKGYNRFVNWLNEVTPKINLENKIPENFQSWGKVFLSNISRDSVDEIQGYDSTVSGMVLGLDRKNKNSLFGVYTGFSDTDLSGLGNNDSQIDSFHLGTYWSLISDSIYFDTSLNYSSNNADNNGPAETEYNSSFDSNNVSLSVSSGLNMNFYDKLFITPEISFLSSSYNRDGYTDSSSIQGLVDKNYSDYKQRSSKLEIGSKFLWIELIENLQSKIIFQPEIRISWLHEFNPTFDTEKYTLEGDTNILEAYLLSQDENLLKTGIGLNFWDLTSYNSNFSFDFDYLKGSSVNEYTLSGSFIYRF